MRRTPRATLREPRENQRLSAADRTRPGTDRPNPGV